MDAGVLDCPNCESNLEGKQGGSESKIVEVRFYCKSCEEHFSLTIYKDGCSL